MYLRRIVPKHIGPAGILEYLGKSYTNFFFCVTQGENCIFVMQGKTGHLIIIIKKEEKNI